MIACLLTDVGGPRLVCVAPFPELIVPGYIQKLARHEPAREPASLSF